jgi:ABC-type branched-subunit amino acid transport system permease subunit
VRTLIGLVLGIVLFVFGIPVLQSVVQHFGIVQPFSYQDAVLTLLLVLACVIATQLTALRPPRSKD